MFMILIALQDQEASNWQNIICRIVPVVHSTHVQRYRYQVHNINTNLQLSTWEIIEVIWIDTKKELLRTGIMAWQMENGLFIGRQVGDQVFILLGIYNFAYNYSQLKKFLWRQLCANCAKRNWISIVDSRYSKLPIGVEAVLKFLLNFVLNSNTYKGVPYHCSLLITDTEDKQLWACSVPSWVTD